VLIVEWTKPALRDMRRVGDRTTIRRIDEAVARFAETGHGDVKALQGNGREFRLRVGEWRVRFIVDERGILRVMVVLRVLPRGGAYAR
jgi:mRNA interferase RelE/StbE